MDMTGRRDTHRHLRREGLCGRDRVFPSSIQVDAQLRRSRDDTTHGVHNGKSRDVVAHGLLDAPVLIDTVAKPRRRSDDHEDAIFTKLKFGTGRKRTPSHGPQHVFRLSALADREHATIFYG